MENKKLREIAKAYRIVLAGCIVTFITALIPLKFSVISIIVAIYVTWMMTQALDASRKFTIIYLVLAFVPVINILALLSLNMRASRFLKAAGIKIVALGVRTADLPATDIT